MSEPVMRIGLRRKRGFYRPVAAAVIMLAGVSVLGFSLDTPLIQSLDGSVGVAVRSSEHAAFYEAMRFFDFLGSTAGFAILTLLIALICLIFRRVMDSLFCIAATAGAWGLNTLAKNVFERPRPELEALLAADGFSFPSGNATISMALIGFAVVIIVTRASTAAGKWLTSLLGFLLMGAVGWARLYGGVHYPTDIIGGYALGAAWLIFITALRNKVNT